MLAPIAANFTTVEAYVVIGDGDTSVLGDKPVHDYAQLLADASPDFDWPELDERQPASMCYTSGTTGDPKGVVYSHRSTFLHAMATLSRAATGADESDRFLAIVPMFHVNAWGIPYGAFLSGASLLFPGPHMTPADWVDCIETERATLVSAVPTIWGGILQLGGQRELDLSSVRMGTSGGAAIPRSIAEAFQKQYGVRIIQGWGMTETSPVGGMAHPPIDVEPGTAEEMDWRMKSGRLLAGVQMRIVDDAGRGTAVGRSGGRRDGGARAVDHRRVPPRRRAGEVRRRVAAHRRHRHHRPARVLPDHRPVEGRHQVRRRVDLLGGAGEPARRRAGRRSRPRSSASPTTSGPSVRWPAWCAKRRRRRRPRSPQYLDGKVASWQVPENWTFIDEVPKTTVGKFDKKVLRARYAEGALDVTRTRD